MRAYSGTFTTESRVNVKRINSRVMVKDILSDAVQILEGRVYYKAFSNDPRSPDSDNLRCSTQLLFSSSGKESIEDIRARRNVHFFSIDSELVYWNFFLDFGPLNLGQLYRFCEKLNDKLQDTRLSNCAICFFSNKTYQKRANAMYLLAAWQLLYLGRSPEEACSFFRDAIFGNSDDESRQNSPRSVTTRNDTGDTLAPIPPFHDASPCECTYDLNLLDCLRGLAKARSSSFFNFDTFNVKEYEYFEQVENGDLSWIVQDKILAFAGPQYQRNVTREGCYTLTPNDYIPYFQKRNIGLVVRLNKKMYEENDFRKAGIEHFEQYYLDGSCPSMSILQNILTAFESVPPGKGFAVHCKAGLGRTGTCIGAFIMKHYRFTAREVIGWMRICRPGMVIGPQQQFLEEIEAQMWFEGDVMRLKPTRTLTVQKTSSFFSRQVRGNQSTASQSDESSDRKLEGHQADGLLCRKNMGYSFSTRG